MTSLLSVFLSILCFDLQKWCSLGAWNTNIRISGLEVKSSRQLSEKIVLPVCRKWSDILVHDAAANRLKIC